MRAWILVAAGALNLLGCSKPRISPQETTIETEALSAHPLPVAHPAPVARPVSMAHPAAPDLPAPLEPPDSKVIVYLLRRVAAATEDRLQGFPAGTEAKVIEDRAEKLLVEIEGMQFEIGRGDVTDDLDLRDRVLARSAERETARLIAAASRAEDRKFLLEEDARWRSFAEAKIERLRGAILSARKEIARYEAEYDNAADNKPLQERISALQTDIANFDREIQILSDSVAEED